LVACLGLSRDFANVTSARFSEETTFSELQLRWTRELIDSARRAKLIKEQTADRNVGFICTQMDRELEEERGIAVVQSFVLACTALSRALTHRAFQGAAEQTGHKYVVATLHGDGEGPAMPVRDAVRFLIRDGDAGRTKRLVDRDAAAAMVEVLVQELTLSAGDEPIPADLLDLALSELMEGLVAQQAKLQVNLGRCLSIGERSTDQEMADAYVSWLQFAPVFPPRSGSFQGDVSYTLLSGLISRSKHRWPKIAACLPSQSLRLFARESARLKQMSYRFEELVGRESERVRELRSAGSGIGFLRMPNLHLAPGATAGANLQNSARDLIRTARRSELITRQIADRPDRVGWICTIMERELESERDIAAVGPFLLACTVLAHALSERTFRGAARLARRKYVYVCFHADPDGDPMTAREAVRFLTRSRVGGARPMINGDQALAILESLARELIAPYNDPNVLDDLPMDQRDAFRAAREILTDHDFLNRVGMELQDGLLEQ